MNWKTIHWHQIISPDIFTKEGYYQHGGTSFTIANLTRELAQWLKSPSYSKAKCEPVIEALIAVYREADVIDTAEAHGAAEVKGGEKAQYLERFDACCAIHPEAKDIIGQAVATTRLFETKAIAMVKLHFFVLAY